MICSSATIAALDRRRADPATSSRPEIRISSTFFYHLSNDYSLHPENFIERVRTSEVVKEAAVKGPADWEENVRDGKYKEGWLVGNLIQVRVPL